MTNIIIKQANSPQEFEAIRQIRETVFQKEQGVDANLDFDGRDETSDRLIASLDGNFIGTARIRYTEAKLAKIERLAVLEAARGHGIGKKLMLHALDIIKKKNIPEVLIHAQEYIKSLHEQIGFQQEGDVFEEAGIRHVKMKKQLK